MIDSPPEKKLCIDVMNLSDCIDQSRSSDILDRFEINTEMRQEKRKGMLIEEYGMQYNSVVQSLIQMSMLNKEQFQKLKHYVNTSGDELQVLKFALGDVDILFSREKIRANVQKTIADILKEREKIKYQRFLSVLTSEEKIRYNEYLTLKIGSRLTEEEVFKRVSLRPSGSSFMIKLKTRDLRN